MTQLGIGLRFKTKIQKKENQTNTSTVNTEQNLDTPGGSAEQGGKNTVPSSTTTPTEASTSQGKVKNKEQINTIDAKNSSISKAKSTQTVKMESNIDFHNLCARPFTEVYNGDPQGAYSFIKKIDSIEILCENNDHRKILIRNILANVKTRALNILPKDPTTIKEITDALTEKIKPEKSNILESRMMTLRLDKTTLGDYSKKVEQLADSLKRSLIVEGITSAKDNEIAVQIS